MSLIFWRHFPPLWNPNVQRRVYKRPPFILSQMNPVYALTYYFLRIHIHTISHIRLYLWSCLFTSRLPDSNVYTLLIIPIRVWSHIQIIGVLGGIPNRNSNIRSVSWQISCFEYFLLPSYIILKQFALLKIETVPKLNGSSTLLRATELPICF
jgi:hypothetical protein